MRASGLRFQNGPVLAHCARPAPTRKLQSGRPTDKLVRAQPTGSFHMLLRPLLFAFLTLLTAAHAHALTADEVKGMAIGETEARVEALAKAAAVADDKTAAFIQAL